MENIKVENMYSLDETIAKKIFDGVVYPWEVLSRISSFIVELGNTLDADKYDNVSENVWIAKRCQNSTYSVHKWAVYN